MTYWPKGLWQHTDFLKLWGGQTLSMFGSLVGKIALPFLVIYTLQASPTQVAWVRVAEIAPGMLVALLAGVWIDRLQRRPIMLWADAGRALVIGSIPVAYWLGHLTLIQVAAVAAVVSLLTVCFDIAYEAYLPTLVEPEHVLDANSKLSATVSIAEVAGFGIAGALFQLIGGAFTLAIDAISFVISACSLAWIRKPEPPPAPSAAREPALHEAREGVKVLLANRVLRSLAGIAGMGGHFGGVMGTVYVLYISRDLQIAPGVQGVLYAFGGISSFFGAALAEPVLRHFGLGKTLVAASVLGLVGYLLIGVAFGPYWLIVLLLIGQQLLGDGADTIYQIHVTSLRQTVTPNHLLGRVNATWRLSNWLFVLVGTVAGGVLAEHIGLRATFLLALAGRAVGLIWLLFSPVHRIRAMPAPAPAEPEHQWV
ncbi:MAG: major facilitator superfamily 1 [Firmicutes bacterium]|nr:major facilitator superfamily 1 [Bacillota bacterium]